MGMLRIIRERPGVRPADLPAASPVAGDTVLATILKDCGFQDTDSEALRYIATLQPSSEGTEDSNPVIIMPLDVTLEDKQTHFQVIEDDVLRYYPPHYHIDCDEYGQLNARYLTQAASADYTFDLTERVATLDLSDDIRTEVVHRGLRRANVNIAAMVEGGQAFECDISDLGQPAGNDLDYLIDQTLSEYIPGSEGGSIWHHWETYGHWTELTWGVYLDGYRRNDADAIQYHDQRLSFHNLFVLKLPDNNSAAVYDHKDRDLSDKRQPIGRVQILGGAGWDEWTEWRTIRFEVSILYYDGVYTGPADFPPEADSNWKALCDDGQADFLTIATHEWVEVDEETIGHKFAKYLMVRLMGISQWVNTSYEQYRYMAIFQEMRVWLPETLYGYAKLGETSPYNTADDAYLRGILQRRTYLSPLDYYQDTQAKADARAATELGELYRNYSRLRVRGVRPDVWVGDTVRITSVGLDIDANYLVESVTVSSDGSVECEMTAYRT